MVAENSLRNCMQFIARGSHFRIRSVAAAILLTAFGGSIAQTFPSRPVEFVVHSGAGGGPDQFVRVVTDTIMQERLLAQPVVVNNRVGGGGSIAFSFIKSKHGDPHYVLGIGTGTLLTIASRSDLDLGLENYTPLAFFGLDAQVVAVAADSKLANVRELIELGKRSPNTQSASLASANGFGRQLLYLMERDAGARFKFVAFKSGVDAALAVAGGHVLFTTENISETQALVEAKKIKLLATSGNKRAAFAPDVPTLKEMGYPFVLGTGRGFAMPAGVSREAAAAMEAVLRRVHDSAAWRAFVARNAYEDVYLNGAEFGAQLVRSREEMEKFLLAIVVAQIRK